MSKKLRTPKSFLALIAMVFLFAACSTPKYYVFKTVKNTPLEKSEAGKEEKAAPVKQLAQDPDEAVAVNEAGAMEEEEKMAVASVEKTAVPLNLEKINQKMAEKAKATPVKQEKVSKFDQIKTAIQIKKELKKIEKQKNVSQDPETTGKSKNQLVALLLGIFLGGFGVHRFYLGYTWQGIVQILLALTSFLIVPGIALLAWVIVDVIRIATGRLQPKKGGGYDPEL